MRLTQSNHLSQVFKTIIAPENLDGSQVDDGVGDFQTRSLHARVRKMGVDASETLSAITHHALIWCRFANST
jgi:hypothetical protein